MVLTAGILPACKMPPQKAWQQIQSEGLMAYMGSEPMERKLTRDSSFEKPADRAPNSNFAWLESEVGNAMGSETPASSPNERRMFSGNVAIKTAPVVPGQLGYVYSPHAAGKIVNVKRFSAGQEVRCPHTGRSFLVPDFDAPRVIDTLPNVDAPSNIVVREGGRDRLSFRTTDSGVAPLRRPIEREEGSETLDPAPPTTIVKPDGLTASRVPGKANQVYSPYAGRNQIVDISGMIPGEKARCPYTNRVFVIPGLQVAKNDVKSKTSPAQVQGKKEVADISDNLEFRVLEGDPDKKMAAKGEPKDKAPAEGSKKDAPKPKAEPKKEVKQKPAPSGASDAGAATPTATWSDKSGFVKSPFGGHLIDVRGKAAGTLVRCPFGDKVFKVPGGSN